MPEVRQRMKFHLGEDHHKHMRKMYLDHYTIMFCVFPNLKLSTDPLRQDPPTAAEMLMSDFREAACILEHLIINQQSYY